jgi:hypothetical protein
LTAAAAAAAAAATAAFLEDAAVAMGLYCCCGITGAIEGLAGGRTDGAGGAAVAGLWVQLPAEILCA